MTMLRRRAFDRRRFLQALGLASGSLFLPSLGIRRAQAAVPPKRLVLFFAGYGTIPDNWNMSIPNLPAGDASFSLTGLAESEFSRILSALYPIRDKLLVVQNLAQITAARSPFTKNQHGVSCNTLLTGQMVKRSSAGNPYIDVGPSVDVFLGHKVSKPGQDLGLNLKGAPYCFDENA